MVQKVMKEMIAYYAGDPARIQHFLKVYEFSRMIGLAEGLDGDLQLTLELSALVHDIGIRPSESIYGDCKGPHQEELGPAEVKKMLEPLGVEPERIERIMYLVGHHHTPDRTLSEEDITGVMKKILHGLESMGIVLRQ